MSSKTVGSSASISLSTIQTDVASILSAAVGLGVGLGALSPGVGQDVLSIGGIVLAAVFQVVGALKLNAAVQAAAAGLRVTR